MSASPSDQAGHPADPGDDRTVIVGPGNNGIALPSGHVVQEFVIDSVVGEGGFSIVYRARDTRLGRHVALKEYMPSDMATRGKGYNVSVRSERHRETFELGLRSFVNEAQLLASFDHPSLVKVYRFWEEGGTAYMVMPLYQSPTLKKWLAQLGTAPDEAWLMGLLMPMIDALEHLHRDHCYHRDIAPDNILLLPAASKQAGAAGSAVYPLLLDFGAARRVIGDATQVLTVILKSGYAPVEQYAESASMQQGPWTDVYALCAVLYVCITGHAPPPSVSRIVADSMLPAVQAGAGRYSTRFLAAIDTGLAVLPQARPQSMSALRGLFAATDAEPPLLPADESAQHAQASASLAASKQTEGRRVLSWGLSLVALALLASGGWWWFGTGGDRAIEEGKPAPSAGSTTIPPAMPAAATGETAPTAAKPVAFSVLAALQDIVDRSDATIKVEAIADKTTLTIGKDLLRFRVTSSEPGYLYVFTGGTKKDHFWLLYPDKAGRNNRIERGQDVVLPPKGSDFVADGPPGTNQIVTVVSRYKRDFSESGLLRTADGEQKFDLAVAQQRWTQRQADASASSPFIGKAVCDAQPCDEAYGATLLEIQEAPARN